MITIKEKVIAHLDNILDEVKKDPSYKFSGMVESIVMSSIDKVLDQRPESIFLTEKTNEVECDLRRIIAMKPTDLRRITTKTMKQHTYLLYAKQDMTPAQLVGYYKGNKYTISDFEQFHRGNLCDGIEKSVVSCVVKELNIKSKAMLKMIQEALINDLDAD